MKDFIERNIDYILEGLVILAACVVIILMVIIATMPVQASEGRLWGIKEARGNITTMIVHNAEIGAIRGDRRETDKRLQEQGKYKKALYNLFGYIPTPAEIELHKRLTQAEAGGEIIAGIERVMEVGANRCRSAYYPNTLTGVYYQRGQYETVSKGIIYGVTVSENVEKAWDRIIRRGGCVDPYVINFTAGGYNKYFRPAYKLGNHYFGYRKE